MGKNNFDNRKKAVQKTAKDKAVAITCIVLAILIVAVIAVSVLNEFAVFDRMNTVVKSGDVKVNKTMMSFFLSDTIMNWYAQYGGYSSLFSVDLSKDLHAQQYGLGYESMFLGEFSGSWYDYFLSQTLENVKMYVVYADAAKAAGLSLTEQDKIDIDTTINGIKEGLKANGSSFSEQYGKGVSEGDVRDCYELIYLASAFMEYKQTELENALDKDDKALYTYVDENKSEFYSAKCLKYTATIKEQSFKTAESYQKQVDKQKALAEKMLAAKTPAEFIDLMEGKKTTTETETTTNTETETTATTESSTSTGKETVTIATETLSPEEVLESKMDKHSVEIEYSTGTGELEDWLFGSEWASEGEVKYFEETGSEAATTTKPATTTTEKATSSEKETSTETETGKAKAGESTSESKTETETKTENKTETETKKTYKTYKIEVYYVLESCDKDYEFVHNFAYLVVDDEAVAKAFKEEFEKGNKTMDAFIALAEKKHNSSHGEGEHDHSDKTFEFNKFEEQPAGAFNDTYNALNKWIEDDARKAGDISDIITVTTKDSNQKDKKTYAIVFFEKDSAEKAEKGQTWYINAYASTVSSQFEKWYNAQLTEKPLDIDTKGLNDINHIIFAAAAH